jgi:GxxExxY protein
MTEAELNALVTRILDAAFVVHRQLGPGLLEAAYKACLLFELKSAGFTVSTEVPVPVIYRGEKLAEVGYRIDLLVENEIVIEVKALEAIAPVHHAQLLSYLKLSNRRLGLLINFNVPMLKDGIWRKVNRL